MNQDVFNYMMSFKWAKESPGYKDSKAVTVPSQVQGEVRYGTDYGEEYYLHVWSGLGDSGSYGFQIEDVDLEKAKALMTVLGLEPLPSE